VRTEVEGVFLEIEMDEAEEVGDGFVGLVLFVCEDCGAGFMVDPEKGGFEVLWSEDGEVVGGVDDSTVGWESELPDSRAHFHWNTREDFEG